jgi:hypothetical protein
MTLKTFKLDDNDRQALARMARTYQVCEVDLIRTLIRYTYNSPQEFRDAIGQCVKSDGVRYVAA